MAPTCKRREREQRVAVVWRPKKEMGFVFCSLYLYIYKYTHTHTAWMYVRGCVGAWVRGCVWKRKAETPIQVVTFSSTVKICTSLPVHVERAHPAAPLLTSACADCSALIDGTTPLPSALIEPCVGSASTSCSRRVRSVGACASYERGWCVCVCVCERG